ncbi:hypothetical protein [Neolewinella antarctica]|uniref:Outer membrane protein beta-barrel domain-containing protein n=1 Tax=Neolewinella antarctica TaxID=442734 RepID=A0ABX0X9P4_9BACT|nr:hypothetical protein [Neolewinella antarctica]NJC25912.1 hypothetical protein [Neolewinella antarctica]
MMRKHIIILFLLATLGQLDAQSKYELSGNVEYGISRIEGRHISNKFTWGNTALVGLYYQTSEKTNSFVLGFGYRYFSTVNSFNDLSIGRSSVRLELGFKRTILAKKLFGTVSVYGDRLVATSANSDDARISSDLEAFSKNYEAGSVVRLYWNIASFVKVAEKRSVLLSIGYEFGFSNLYDRYFNYLSATALPIRSRSIRAGISVGL